MSCGEMVVWDEKGGEGEVQCMLMTDHARIHTVLKKTSLCSAVSGSCSYIKCVIKTSQ